MSRVGVGVTMGRNCIYFPNVRCFRLSCSGFDCATGNVTVCDLNRGDDMFARRKVAPVHGSIFSKHVLRRRGGGLFG